MKKTFRDKKHKDLSDAEFIAAKRADWQVFLQENTITWTMGYQATIPKAEITSSVGIGLGASHRTKLHLSYLYYYNIDYVSDAAFVRTGAFSSPVPRAGILTQPSWLQAYSTFTDNHVVLRGKWIREKLLGGGIPDVPIGVEAAIPDDPDKPLRDRLSKTKQEFCWRCHERMDPLGWPFEIYNDFGSYRGEGRERLINGKLGPKLDSDGAIINSGDPALDGPVEDAIEMLHKLANSAKVRQVFVRHVFRYFMGRNETLVDSKALIAADQAYVDSDGSFRALVESILSSDSFIYRKSPVE